MSAAAPLAWLIERCDLDCVLVQFPLHHPAVTAAVIGARTAAEITIDVSHLGVDIPGALWAELDVARQRRGLPVGPNSWHCGQSAPGQRA